MSNRMDPVDDWLIQTYMDEVYGCIGGFAKFQHGIFVVTNEDILKTLRGNVLSPEAFFSAASILLARPSACNRAVFSTSQALGDRFKLRFSRKSKKVRDDYQKRQIFDEMAKYMVNPFTQSTLEYIEKNEVAVVILVRRVLLKEMRGETDVYELWDFEGGYVTFLPVRRAFNDNKYPTPKGVPAMFGQLKIRLVRDKFVASLMLLGSADCPSDKFWLQNYVEHIFPKFLKWANTQPKLAAEPGPTISLALISHEAYQQHYKSMKTKYMANMFQIWENAQEKTDPSKFVPEEMGIASYIQVLQQTSGYNFDKKFVDFGCGNGLLTYFLRSEGWEGIGLDIRKRRIWDFLPNMEDALKVGDVMDPKLNYPIPANSLLIGNHPDELTPYIPIIAASHRCPFIIIPCCAFDWDGKYERMKSDDMPKVGSTYQSFLNSTISLAKASGYECTVDRLRIPSTKKLALIGIYKEKNTTTIKEKNDSLENFTSLRLKEEFCKTQSRCGSGVSKAKTTVEKAMAIRNCTSLPKDEVQAVILKIFFYIMNNALVSDEDYKHESGVTWNRGSQTTTLIELVNTLGSQLKLLKNQNKGLQTLLRNHKYIFALEEGTVRLRVPVSSNRMRITTIKSSVLKKKHCFFDIHHPDHCPLPAEECCYSHRCERDLAGLTSGEFELNTPSAQD